MDSLIAIVMVVGAVYLFIPQFRTWINGLLSGGGKKKDKATIQSELEKAEKDLIELEEIKKASDQLNEKKRRIAELKKELK